MINKFNTVFNKILYVSRLSHSINKKMVGLFVILLANISAFLDVLIIISITSIFSETLSSNKLIQGYVEFYQSYKFTLLIIVVSRFFTLFLQKVYTKRIELLVDQDLKSYISIEVFKKNNFSISDSLFFVNVLTQHISFFYSSFMNFLIVLTQVVAYLIFLSITNLRILIFAILIFLILIFPITRLFSLSRQSMHDSFIFSKEASNFIQNVIENVFLIKIYNKGNQEINKISKSLEERTNSMIKNDIYGNLTSIMPTFIVFIIFSTVSLSSQLIKLITIDFLGVVLRLFQSLALLASSFNKMVNSYVHIEELEDIEKNKEKINADNFIQHDDLNTRYRNIIEINSLDFKYFRSEEFMFKNLNLVIEQGKNYLILGPNGSGKSTLLALMTGVLIPSQGSVTCNTKKIGYVGPNPLIIQGTIRDNILYGNDDPVEDIKIIALAKEIKLFSNFDETSLDQSISNKTLSSGQMQKISFMRVFLKKIDLLVLDESTSNLDENSKNIIVEKLKLLKNVTILNSTHEKDLFDFFQSSLQISISGADRVVTQS